MNLPKEKSVQKENQSGFETTTKRVLNSKEAASYMGISLSYLHKLTMRRAIPHYKPLGKLLFFDRNELNEWLKRCRVATDEELTRQANDYCKKGGIR